MPTSSSVQSDLSIPATSLLEAPIAEQSQLQTARFLAGLTKSGIAFGIRPHIAQAVKEYYKGSFSEKYTDDVLLERDAAIIGEWVSALWASASTTILSKVEKAFLKTVGVTYDFVNSAGASVFVRDVSNLLTTDLVTTMAFGAGHGIKGALSPFIELNATASGITSTLTGAFRGALGSYVEEKFRSMYGGLFGNIEKKYVPTNEGRIIDMSKFDLELFKENLFKEFSVAKIPELFAEFLGKFIGYGSVGSVAPAIFKVGEVSAFWQPWFQGLNSMSKLVGYFGMSKLFGMAVKGMRNKFNSIVEVIEDAEANLLEEGRLAGSEASETNNSGGALGEDAEENLLEEERLTGSEASETNNSGGALGDEDDDEYQDALGDEDDDEYQDALGDEDDDEYQDSLGDEDDDEYQDAVENIDNNVEKPFDDFGNHIDQDDRDSTLSTEEGNIDDGEKAIEESLSNDSLSSFSESELETTFNDSLSSFSESELETAFGGVAGEAGMLERFATMGMGVIEGLGFQAFFDLAVAPVISGTFKNHEEKTRESILGHYGYIKWKSFMNMQSVTYSWALAHHYQFRLTESYIYDLHRINNIDRHINHKRIVNQKDDISELEQNMGKSIIYDEIIATRTLSPDGPIRAGIDFDEIYLYQSKWNVARAIGRGVENFDDFISDDNHASREISEFINNEEETDNFFDETKKEIRFVPRSHSLRFNEGRQKVKLSDYDDIVSSGQDDDTAYLRAGRDLWYAGSGQDVSYFETLNKIDIDSVIQISIHDTSNNKYFENETGVTAHRVSVQEGITYVLEVSSNGKLYGYFNDQGDFTEFHFDEGADTTRYLIAPTSSGDIWIKSGSDMPSYKLSIIAKESNDNQEDPNYVYKDVLYYVEYYNPDEYKAMQGEDEVQVELIQVMDTDGTPVDIWAFRPPESGVVQFVRKNDDGIVSEIPEIKVAYEDYRPVETDDKAGVKLISLNPSYKNRVGDTTKFINQNDEKVDKINSSKGYHEYQVHLKPGWYLVSVTNIGDVRTWRERYSLNDEGRPVTRLKLSGKRLDDHYPNKKPFYVAYHDSEDNSDEFRLNPQPKLSATTHVAFGVVEEGMYIIKVELPRGVDEEVGYSLRMTSSNQHNINDERIQRARFKETSKEYHRSTAYFGYILKNWAKAQEVGLLKLINIPAYLTGLSDYLEEKAQEAAEREKSKDIDKIIRDQFLIVKERFPIYYHNEFLNDNAMYGTKGEAKGSIVYDVDVLVLSSRADEVLATGITRYMDFRAGNDIARVDAYAYELFINGGLGNDTLDFSPTQVPINLKLIEDTSILDSRSFNENNIELKVFDGYSDLSRQGNYRKEVALYIPEGYFITSFNFNSLLMVDGRTMERTDDMKATLKVMKDERVVFQEEFFLWQTVDLQVPYESNEIIIVFSQEEEYLSENESDYYNGWTWGEMVRSKGHFLKKSEYFEILPLGMNSYVRGVLKNQSNDNVSENQIDDNDGYRLYLMADGTYRLNLLTDNPDDKENLRLKLWSFSGKLIQSSFSDTFKVQQNGIYFVEIIKNDQTVDDVGYQLVLTDDAYEKVKDSEDFTLKPGYMTENNSINHINREYTIVASDFENIILGDLDDNFRMFDGLENLRAGNGRNKIYGNTLNNIIIGGADDDILRGGAGNDILDGGAGNDTLDGGADDDILEGGTGNDILKGGTGNDTLIGGTGNNTYKFDSQEFGFDSIFGTEGNSELEFSFNIPDWSTIMSAVLHNGLDDQRMLFVSFGDKNQSTDYQEIPAGFSLIYNDEEDVEIYFGNAPDQNMFSEFIKRSELITVAGDLDRASQSLRAS